MFIVIIRSEDELQQQMLINWKDYTYTTASVLRFQMVFDMLVLQKHNTEMTTAAGEAFYTLVCLHQVWYSVTP